jgi:hypothetical protein
VTARLMAGRWAERPGLVSVDVAVPPDGESGDLEVAGVSFRRKVVEPGGAGTSP